MAKTKLKPGDLSPDLEVLGAKVDTLITQQEQRLGLQRRVKTMKEDEDELALEIVKLLHDMKLDGAKGNAGSVGFRRLNVPQLVDETAFLKWVQARMQERKDMLKIGINNEAWRERVADGVKVPGVEGFVKETLGVYPSK
jgi:hypothetical protein